MIFLNVSALTAADLALDDQKITVVDPDGLSKTVRTKSSFLLTRVEFQKATVALADVESMMALLEASDFRHESAVAMLVTCQNERDVLEVRVTKRLIWIIAAGSAGLAIGVLTGVLVR